MIKNFLSNPVGSDRYIASARKMNIGGGVAQSRRGRILSPVYGQFVCLFASPNFYRVFITNIVFDKVCLATKYTAAVHFCAVLLLFLSATPVLPMPGDTDKALPLPTTKEAPPATEIAALNERSPISVIHFLSFCLVFFSQLTIIKSTQKNGQNALF